MASKPTLSEEVHDLIHFDTLFEQGKQVLRDHANETWDDLAEHDPGITLLQALTYNVSDLAYRHTLPLQDLLTPKSDGKEKEAAIFSQQFAPEHMLTTSPITEDDYRRALLDLHSSDDKENADKYTHHDFYFRNAQLKLEPKEKRYRYWHDLKARQFLFMDPTKGSSASANDVRERELLGGFTLYVELSLGMTRERAEKPLEQFLQTHRNLCEQVREIIWVKPYADHVFRADIELEDDCQDAEKVIAQILIKAHAMVSPNAQHLSIEELRVQKQSNESIYQGPYLKHGWIPVLPPARDYAESSTITISLLVNQLLEIDGVKRIQKLGFGGRASTTEVQWEGEIPANAYPQIWQENTFNTASDIGVLSEQVVLLKRGQCVPPDKEKILQYINSMRAPLINPQSAPLLQGRLRKLSDYHKASQYLPPCYGVQALSPNSKQAQLRQFLLPFEQQLADGCDQLALLSTLLSFERGGDNHDGSDVRVWGNHLAFLQSQKDAPADLIKFLEKKDQDPIKKQAIVNKERAIINYLLGYFGARPVTKVLLKEGTQQDYLSIQRGYLAQQGKLGYGRASIQVNAVSALQRRIEVSALPRRIAVSALQRRIAARLGVGAALFKEEPDLSNLPFYVVEHMAFMPKQPPDGQSRISEWKNVVSIAVNLGASSITIKMDKVGGFKDNDYINLIIADQFFVGVQINSVNDKNIKIDLNKHEQLQAYIEKNKSNINELVGAEKTKLQKCDSIRSLSVEKDGKLIIALKKGRKGLGFDRGHLIDLQIGAQTVFRLMIRKVSEDKEEITLYINDSMQLKNVVGDGAKIDPATVHLYSSMIWLKDKSHPISFCKEGSSQDKNIYFIKSDIYPVPLNIKDEIVISSKSNIDKGVAVVESISNNISNEKNFFEIKLKDNFKIVENEDVWYFKKNEIKDRFTFTVSVVFNRKWLADVLDPYATMEWVKEIVAEEIPCHISAKIHWLDEGQFSRFGRTYGEWQKNDTPLGDLSYQLMSDLSLGELPTPIKGIGMMMIGWEENPQRQKFTNDDGTAKPAWEDKAVQQTGLFYVP